MRGPEVLQQPQQRHPISPPRWGLETNFLGSGHSQKLSRKRWSCPGAASPSPISLLHV